MALNGQRCRGAPRSNFTNEIGVSGTVRFLKNVMGLWILDACRREWSTRGIDLVVRLAGTHRGCPPPPGWCMPDAGRFFNPSNMTAELRQALSESRQPAPEDLVALTRTIIDSLALRYAAVIDDIERLTGESIRGIHIVGGGSLNDLLNQAAADRRRPVLAGPVEAAALGNLCAQAIASGELPSIAEGRRLLAAADLPRRFDPRDSPAWRAARHRYAELERDRWSLDGNRARGHGRALRGFSPAVATGAIRGHRIDRAAGTVAGHRENRRYVGGKCLLQRLQRHRRVVAWPGSAQGPRDRRR